MGELIDEGLWRLLWMPPTLPYWPLEGPFEGKEHATKRLLFSAWNLVPDVVSAVLSYEAERLMMGGRLDSYDNPDAQQRPLLRLTQTATGVRSRHRLLLLLLPCLPLADRAHPLDAPAGQDRRSWVRARVDELLADPRLPNPREGSIDDRWEWAAPLLLDPELPAFLRAWRDGELPAWSDNEPLPQPNPDLFGAYVDDLLAVDLQSLGRRPPDLAELLTDLALGSPAILAARSLRGGGDVGDDTRRRLAALIADAFWRLFNRPAVISLLRQLAAGTAAVGDESAYWRLVLHYCRQGNLQAVLDEQWHLLWEQDSWSEDASADDTAAKCARKLVQVVHPARARVHAEFFRAERGESGATVERDAIRVRTVFALRFGRTDDGEHVSQDAVRAAFNSPFRPFVLTSTSIGQEGLDFHPWCHRLVHWNLPGNPVDLEQREGRIHRYKGHAVRRNVAGSHAGDAFASWRAGKGKDIWKLIFDLADQAARDADESDLVPHWMAPGEHRVERHVPQLPYTAEVEAFDRLKRQLAAYRVVFGQPRQEELVTLLDRAGVDVAAQGLGGGSLTAGVFGVSLLTQRARLETRRQGGRRQRLTRPALASRPTRRPFVPRRLPAGSLASLRVFVRLRPRRSCCAAVLAQSSRCFEFMWDLLARPCGDLQQPLDVVCVAPAGAPCNEYGLYRILGAALRQSATRFVRRVGLAGFLRRCQSFNGLLQPPVCVVDVMGFRLPP